MQTSPKRPSPLELRKLIGSVNQLRFNDNRGEVSFFGQKMIILRRDVFHVMREGLERLVGEQAAPFLSFLASGIGVHEGSIFRDSAKTGVQPERANLENLIHTAFEDTNLGLGKIKVSNLDFDKGSALVNIGNCFEALENETSDAPNCMFTSGFLAGLFAEVFDKTVHANEVHCISQGHPECEFQISPVDKATLEQASSEVGSAASATSGVSAQTETRDAEGKPDERAEAKVIGTGPVAKEQDSAGNQVDFDAGVEKAARIAKRKQGFWEKLFKK